MLKRRIWIALSAVYVAWGSTYLAIRFAVETIPPFFMAGTRFFLAALILFTWRIAAGDPWPRPAQWRSAIIVGCLLLVGGNGLVSWAEQTVPSGVAALTVASVPIWMALLDAIRPAGKRPVSGVIIGVVAGFGGIVLLVGDRGHFTGPDSTQLIGIGALLLASLLWAAGSVYSHVADMPTSAILGTAVQMLAGAVGLFIVSFLSGEWSRVDPLAISPRSALSLLYLVFVGSLIGFASYAWLLRNAPLSLVSTYAYVNPAVALVLGALAGGERLSARTLFAAAIIICSVILINGAHQATSRQSAKGTRTTPDRSAT